MPWRGPRRTRLLVIASLVVGGGAVGSAHGAVAFIASPSGNLGCQIADRYVGITEVFCQSARRPQSVRMGLSGALRICRGVRCLGDGPEGIVTLRYSKSRRVGRFRCTSLRVGMRCVVIATGKGFLIDRSTVKRVHVRPAAS